MNIEIHKLDGKTRNRNIRLQIILSFLAKGLSILLNLYIVPLMLNYLGKEMYAIWMIMLSITSWITLCDIGIGHGLRNKLAECLSENNKEKSLAYISTSYILLFLIAIAVISISIFTFPNINWAHFFNSHEITIPYLNIMLSFIVFIMVFFSLGLINSILAACQLNSWSSYALLISSVLFIGGLLLLPDSFHDNLLAIVLLYGLSNTLSLIIISFLFFRNRKYLIPRFNYLKTGLIKDIVSLGSQFFIIQTASIVTYSSGNILIAHLLEPAQVTDYNIVFRIFSVFIVGFNIITTPYWSAFTEAYSKQDFVWIKNSIRKLSLLLIPVSFILILFVFFFNRILLFWLGAEAMENIIITRPLVVMMAVFVFISMWNNIYSFFLNGISRTKMQVGTSIIGAVLMIPFSYIFVKLANLDITGIVLAMSLSFLPFFIIGPVMTFKMIKNESVS